jgi:hypothetical protein
MNSPARWPGLLLGTEGGPPLVILATLLAGCAEYGYRQVQLGQEQQLYRATFPEDQTRRTAVGVCYLETDPFGRTEAAVLLLTADRRVAGKLHAKHVERRWGSVIETSYQLRGELDPELLKLGGTGPIDTLRAIADELTAGDGDSFVREVHGWVAAGLVRLVQHWPHAGDEGPALPRLSGVLERVAAGGQARITVDPRGVFVVEYTQTAARR